MSAIYLSSPFDGPALVETVFMIGLVIKLDRSRCYGTDCASESRTDRGRTLSAAYRASHLKMFVQPILVLSVRSACKVFGAYVPTGMRAQPLFCNAGMPAGLLWSAVRGIALQCRQRVPEFAAALPQRRLSNNRRERWRWWRRRYPSVRGGRPMRAATIRPGRQKCRLSAGPCVHAGHLPAATRFTAA